MSHLDPRVASITRRIVKNSEQSRKAYLDLMKRCAAQGPVRGKLSCANLAHGMAAAPSEDKPLLRAKIRPNIGIVTAFNDMLSAHQPYESYPQLIKQAARTVGATAQVAGGVPAMCDGVTQGEVGMDLSLFSREVIALSTAVSLAHNMFDAAICLGICDKIVPGLLIGALRFGYLPVIFIPAGPMTSGISQHEKSRTRELFAQGKVDKEALLESETKCFHGPGTCTFFGTANSNQMLMDVMGVHLPGAAFVNPYTPLRDALTVAATQRVASITALGTEYIPLCEVLEERAFVNGIVALLATGGSTNHTIHLIAIARAAGIKLTWDDFSELSGFVPQIASIYPNGPADVNQFHAAGGSAFLVRELLDAGLLHEDVTTNSGIGLRRYGELPELVEGGAKNKVRWNTVAEETPDPIVVRNIKNPFRPDGGLKVLDGNLGRGVIKTSALKQEQYSVTAPAIVFDSQEDVHAAFQAGKLDRDFIAVVWFQGPHARGMPELHRLIPILSVIQDRGFAVGLVTDGRMSGASGKVTSAIHVSPEAAERGPITKVRDGDVITIDSLRGVLNVAVSPDEWEKRESVQIDLTKHHEGCGRELFASFREQSLGAEQGAGMPFSNQN